MAGNGARRPPTLEDVARLAGVSTMTASRAINGGPNVSERSAQLVRAAQEELSYVPNQAARQLITRRTDVIALIAPLHDERLFDDQNLAMIYPSSSKALAIVGLQLVVLVASTEAERVRASRFVRAGHVDGAVLISPELLGDLPLELLTASVPIVATGGVEAVKAIGRGVIIDTRGAVRSAAERLRRGGARSIALVAGPAGNAATALQVLGYMDSLTEGDVPLCLHGDYTADSGEAAAHRLLSSHPSIDGLVVASDVMASGALRTAARSGRHVPSDLQVIGFDDSPVSQMTTPALSTVHVPFAEIGAELATLLVDALQDVPPRIATLSTRVIERQSSRPT